MDEQTLLAQRARKDADFKAGGGPFRGRVPADFAGLAFYPPDPAYALSAPVELGEEEELYEFQTSSGQLRSMHKLGVVRLKLPVGEVSLSLFTPQGAPGDNAFLPFRDATSGEETYGAGRYLDVPVQGGVAELDFNQAYQPYCAYAEGYSCPIPPAENRLSLAIRAGERQPELK